MNAPGSPKSSPKPSRSRSAALLAILAATIALAGAGQALIPALAGAVMQEGEECLYTPWLAECEEEHGGGGGSWGGGGGWGENGIGPGGGSSDSAYEREHRSEINELDRELENDTAKENAEEREREARVEMEQERASEYEEKGRSVVQQWLETLEARRDETTCSNRLAEAHFAQQDGNRALADSKLEDFQACRAIAIEGLPNLGKECLSERAAYEEAEDLDETSPETNLAEANLNLCIHKKALGIVSGQCNALIHRADELRSLGAGNIAEAEEFLACADGEKEMRQKLMKMAKKRNRLRESVRRHHP